MRRSFKPHGELSGSRGGARQRRARWFRSYRRQPPGQPFHLVRQRVISAIGTVAVIAMSSILIPVSSAGAIEGQREIPPAAVSNVARVAGMAPCAASAQLIGFKPPGTPLANWQPAVPEGTPNAWVIGGPGIGGTWPVAGMATTNAAAFKYSVQAPAISPTRGRPNDMTTVVHAYFNFVAIGQTRQPTLGLALLKVENIDPRLNANAVANSCITADVLVWVIGLEPERAGAGNRLVSHGHTIGGIGAAGIDVAVRLNNAEGRIQLAYLARRTIDVAAPG
jgi:hypothetical protein